MTEKREVALVRNEKWEIHEKSEMKFSVQLFLGFFVAYSEYTVSNNFGPR